MAGGEHSRLGRGHRGGEDAKPSDGALGWAGGVTQAAELPGTQPAQRHARCCNQPGPCAATSSTHLQNFGEGTAPQHVHGGGLAARGLLLLGGLPRSACVGTGGLKGRGQKG
jgi:hypothetical protein